MKTHIRSTIYLFCTLLVLLSFKTVFSAESSSIVPNIPPGLIIEEEYKPGLGRSLGSVRLVQGRVVIMHADMKKGYLAKEGIPLYKGDIIVTQDDGRIRFGLRDGSVVTLAFNTRLELSESVFDRKKKSRFSFLKLGLGKARFLITKLVNYRRSNVKVKTPTAVVGVRGSEFIVEATLTETVLTTYGDTMVDFFTLDFPEELRTLGSFKSSMSRKGIPPTIPRDVSPQEAEEKKKDFLFPSDEDKPEGIEKEPTKDEEPDETAYDLFDLAQGILIPEDDLVDPEALGDISEPDVSLNEIMKENEDITRVQELIEQTSTEDAVGELPEFPGTPN